MHITYVCQYLHVLQNLPRVKYYHVQCTNLHVLVFTVYESLIYVTCSIYRGQNSKYVLANQHFLSSRAVDFSWWVKCRGFSNIIQSINNDLYVKCISYKIHCKIQGQPNKTISHVWVSSVSTLRFHHSCFTNLSYLLKKLNPCDKSPELR